MPKCYFNNGQRQNVSIVRWQGKRGFTLIEILLGLSMVAIVGLAVYQIFASSMKLDHRLELLHENHMEVLMADALLSRELENAISLDVSANYNDQYSFVGKQKEFSFLNVTDTGIKRVTYRSGLINRGRMTRTIIGGKIQSPKDVLSSPDSLPVEFLLRKEQTLVEWLDGRKTPADEQIIVAGLKKGSFSCRYAPANRDLVTQGEKALNWKDAWNEQGLPMAVNCSFEIYDPKRKSSQITFKRDFYLSPIWSVQDAT